MWRLVVAILLAPALTHAQPVSQGADSPGGIPGFDCSAGSLAEAERVACRARELRFHDLKLRTWYQELQKTLERDAADAMIKTHREWARQRDAACGLPNAPRERDEWLRHIAEEAKRSNCVLDMIRGRIAQFEPLFPPVGVQAIAKVVPQAARDEPKPPSISDSPEVLARSANRRRTGKYYFEVVVERGRILQPVEAEIVARISDGQHAAGTSYQLRPADVVLQLPDGGSVIIQGGNLGSIRLPKVVIGVAADLDAGRLYRHRDGVWEKGIAPGHPAGEALPRDRDFVAQLAASAAARPLVEEDILAVNFGDRPFERPPPAGYLAFDSAEGLAARRSTHRALTYEPHERVAGIAQTEWVQRYWEWARSFPEADSPSRDETGYRCGWGQSGPVWFLTGSRETKAMRRECEVPPGKILLVPLINVLMQATPGKGATCETVLVALDQFGAHADDLGFSLNGSPLTKPESYLHKTGCFMVRDARFGQAGIAAGAGYWVFIKPLPEGIHELEFRGSFPGTKFQQDIRYMLHVR